MKLQNERLGKHCSFGCRSVIFKYYVFMLIVSPELVECSAWDEWWAYDGISGPQYWGLINNKWSLCNKGKRQSPIDIVPEQLLFDPTLESIQIIGNYINGTIENTGRGVLLQLAHNAADHDKAERLVINRGPLSYNYTLDHIMIHYGRDNNRGSEHTIAGVRFPGEIQLYCYNSQLYGNWTDAHTKPHGVAAISILVQLANYDHPDESEQLKQIVSALRDLSNNGQRQPVTGLSIVGLMPSSIKNYITYEGSLTQPSCSENVEWLVMNKPIYVSSHQMNLIRNSLNGLGDNYRPSQPLLRRCIRTNINFAAEETSANKNAKSCYMNKFTTYKSVQRQRN